MVFTIEEAKDLATKRFNAAKKAAEAAALAVVKRAANRDASATNAVHSVNFTSATNVGLTQVVTASSFTFAAKGDFAVLSGISLPCSSSRNL